MRDFQLVDKRECREVLTAFGNLGQLALKVANVRFEVVALPYLDSEKMIVVSLSLLTKCVLGEECFGHLLEVVEKMRRKNVKSI